MALKDLSGKTVYDLEREDFEKLFCRHRPKFVKRRLVDKMGRQCYDLSF